MICHKCNTEIMERTVDLSSSCVELGEMTLRDMEARSCECTSMASLNHQQSKAYENKREKAIEELTSKLPIGLFIPKGKFHPKRLIISKKIGKQTFIYRPSLEQYSSTGDGRLNLVAELAKHDIIIKTAIGKINREGAVII